MITFFLKPRRAQPRSEGFRSHTLVTEGNHSREQIGKQIHRYFLIKTVFESTFCLFDTSLAFPVDQISFKLAEILSYLAWSKYSPSDSSDCQNEILFKRQRTQENAKEI